MKRLVQSMFLAAVVLSTACQDYEFTPVVPVTFRQTESSRKVVAKQYKPNLMLLIDRSQSMSFPMENGVSRWQQLQSAFDTYLTTSGSVARMGLMTFPSDFACGAGTVVVDLWTQNDDPTALQNHADSINAAIQNTTPQGVTPTGQSLKVLSNYPALASGRENVIVLATDGLPNCNPDNPNDYNVDQVACDCTFAADQCGGDFHKLSCLDKDGTVQAVRDLLAKGIKTAVVGFGADVATVTGGQVMNAIASEGGAARRCPNGTDAECGSGNRCEPSTKICDLRYYRANSEAELAAALATIGYDLSQGEACVFQLDVSPPDASQIRVMFDGEPMASSATTWTYDAGVITFHDAACTRLANSTPDDPANVEFSVLDML